MVILGIDPGLSGELAFLENGRLLEIVDIEASQSRINSVHLAPLITATQPRVRHL